MYNTTFLSQWPTAFLRHHLLIWRREGRGGHGIGPGWRVRKVGGKSRKGNRKTFHFRSIPALYPDDAILHACGQLTRHDYKLMTLSNGGRNKKHLGSRRLNKESSMEKKKAEMEKINKLLPVLQGYNQWLIFLTNIATASVHPHFNGITVV